MSRHFFGRLAGTIVLASFSCVDGAPAADCNGNGVPDELGLQPRTLAFVSSARVIAPPAPAAVSGIDVDADGDVDLAIAHSGRALLSVHPNQGDASSMVPAATQPTVLADAGVENANANIDELIGSGVLRRVLAMTEIAFSNSMIESWWRSLKHQWLFLNTLDTVSSLRGLVSFYVRRHDTSRNTTAGCPILPSTGRRQTRCTFKSVTVSRMSSPSGSRRHVWLG